jgi:hypothetical protein
MSPAMMSGPGLRPDGAPLWILEEESPELLFRSNNSKSPKETKNLFVTDDHNLREIVDQC